MAYKFQRGNAVASGSFTAEHGLTSGDGFTVSAGTVTLPASSVATAALAASSVTIGSTSVSLGATATSLDGLTTIDTTNIEVTNIKAKDGTAAVTVADTTGHVTITNLTGTSVDINGGAIDNVTIGTSTAVTQFTASNSSLGVATATSLSSSNNIQGGGSLTIAGASVFNGNVTLGDAGTDIISVGGAFTSSLNPNASGQNDLGITTKLWRNVKSQYLSSSIDLLVGGTATVATSLTAATLTASLGSTLGATVVTTITGSSTATFQSMTSNNVTIGGGTINATPIGGTTQAAGQFTTLSASSALQVGTSITASSGVLVNAGGLTVSAGDSSVQKLTVNGDLIVLGSTFSASVGTLVIEDKQIVLADGAPNAAAAYGAGFFVSGANAEWTLKQNGEGAAASSGEIFVASGSSGLRAIQASSFYGSLVGSMASTVSASVGGATLVTGVNYFGTVGGAVSVTLPASAGLSIGNSVKVKAGSDCSTTNTITINKDGSQTIDGETFVVLESPWAALEFVYVTTDTWRIF
jgi:fibronectin-binding autotransporter adhesin